MARPFGVAAASASAAPSTRGSSPSIGPSDDRGRRSPRSPGQVAIRTGRLFVPRPAGVGTPSGGAAGRRRSGVPRGRLRAPRLRHRVVDRPRRPRDAEGGVGQDAIGRRRGRRGGPTEEPVPASGAHHVDAGPTVTTISGAPSGGSGPVPHQRATGDGLGEVVEGSGAAQPATASAIPTTHRRPVPTVAGRTRHHRRSPSTASTMRSARATRAGPLATRGDDRGSRFHRGSAPRGRRGPASPSAKPSLRRVAARLARVQQAGDQPGRVHHDHDRELQRPVADSGADQRQQRRPSRSPRWRSGSPRRTGASDSGPVAGHLAATAAASTTHGSTAYPTSTGQ